MTNAKESRHFSHGQHDTCTVLCLYFMAWVCCSDGWSVHRPVLLSPQHCTTPLPPWRYSPMPWAGPLRPRPTQMALPLQHDMQNQLLRALCSTPSLHTLHCMPPEALPPVQRLMTPSRLRHQSIRVHLTFLHGCHAVAASFGGLGKAHSMSMALLVAPCSCVR